MNKKTCEACGKIWIAEKFDQHPCVQLVPAKKSRIGAKAKAEKLSLK